jgi:polyisoprenoid-binding protein YceI
MTELLTRPETPRNKMKRHWKWIVGAVVGVILLVIAGSFIYAKVINKADPAFGQDDVNAKLDAATTTAALDPLVLSTTVGTDPAVDPAATTTVVSTQSSVGADAAAGAADGVWNIKEGSEVGYRVKETISGFDTTANGRTQAITGTMTADGTTISKGEFIVDMTTFESDESRRDEQFNTRVMDVANFPTSTFILTQPIDFGAIPPEGGSVNATATGDLTLHGTTKPVTFDVQGTFKNGLVGVLGQIPVVFADYGIPAPSLGPVKTEDNGLLEFVLVLEHE